MWEVMDMIKIKMRSTVRNNGAVADVFPATIKARYLMNLHWTR